MKREEFQKLLQEQMFEIAKDQAALRTGEMSISDARARTRLQRQEFKKLELISRQLQLKSIRKRMK